MTKSSRELYKYLLKCCSLLPKSNQRHYRYLIRSNFESFRDETDQERINQLIEKSIEDSKWILNKYKVDEDLVKKLK